MSGDEGRSLAHTQLVLQDLGMIMSDGVGGYEAASSKTLGWDRFDETPKSEWQAVFGTANAALDDNVKNAPADDNEWDNLFGDEVLGSTFQDGQYVYTVVAGGGTGVDAYPPTIYVVDVESAVDFNNVLMP